MSLLRDLLAEKVQWRCVCGNTPHAHLNCPGQYGVCLRYRARQPSKLDRTDMWLYRLIRWLVRDYQPELERDVWIVPKVEHKFTRVRILDGGWIPRDEAMENPEATRRYAAQLLAAADRAEALADKQESTGEWTHN